MSGRDWHRSWESHAAFYADAYGHAVLEVRPAGRTGATLMRTQQEAGDWSDAPTPDLVIGVLTSSAVTIAGDLGAGHFRDRYRRGTWVVQPPNNATETLAEGAHAFAILSVPYVRLLDLAGGDSGLPLDGGFGRLHAGLQRDAEVPALLDRLWREGATGSPHGALWADGALLQLAAALLRLRDGPAGPPARGGLAPWQVRRVAEFVEADLAADAGLAELAALVGLSPFHFARAFKASTGQPPARWRAQRRMERARELLASTGLPVTEVAALVGYGDPGQFAAAFRKSVGATPSAYRRERGGGVRAAEPLVGLTDRWGLPAWATSSPTPSRP